MPRPGSHDLNRRAIAPSEAGVEGRRRQRKMGEGCRAEEAAALPGTGGAEMGAGWPSWESARPGFLLPRAEGTAVSSG